MLSCHPHPSGMRLSAEGLSHGLKNSPPDCFSPRLRRGRPFESTLPIYQKSRHQDGRRGHGSQFPSTSLYGMHLETEGLSHGLKNSPLDCFSPRLRRGRPFESCPTYQKMRIPLWVSAFFGTPEGTRTPNPRNRNPMLYPLSHRCICLKACLL